MTLDQKEEKRKPAMYEHLLRWQTAKSALAPVVASHAFRPHSVFLHYSSDFSWAKLSCPASRASGCKHKHHSAEHARLFFWQCQIFRSAYRMKTLVRIMCSHFGETYTSGYGDFSQIPSTSEIINYSFESLYLERKIFLVVWIKTFSATRYICTSQLELSF